jgi:phenylpyruvate tautomerase PptA (4-oxalocrotonate tautomerase family)
VLLEITVFPGRSPVAKRLLFAAIARRFVERGIPAADVLVVLHEPPLESWGLHGAQATEVDLGFPLDL